MGAKLLHFISKFTLYDYDIGRVALLLNPYLWFPKIPSLFLEREMRGDFLVNEGKWYPKSYICLLPFMLFVYSRVPWRLLESRPPFTTILHKYPGPANYHRGVWFLWNAQGLLPLPAGRLETWDSGDVWPTQGQRKGKKEKKKACRVWICRPSLLGLTRLPFGFVCDNRAGLSFPALHGESSPGLRYDLKWYRLFLSF